MDDDALFPAPVPAAVVTAGTLVAGWIEACTVRPPARVISQVGKYVREMLTEGVPAAAIEAGLVVWRQRGLAPVSLPAVVNGVANAAPPKSARQQQTDRLQAGWTEWARRESP